jgi:O-antigen/teichoic acid export membrane protein
LAADLTRGLVRSLPWAAGEALYNALHGVLTVVVIGRFIAPEELGAAGTAIATVFLVEVASGAGLQDAVVRSKSADTMVTDTAFTVALAFALLGVAACGIAAYPVAIFMGDIRLWALILAASLLLPFNALAAIPAAIFARKMRASKLTLRLVGARILGFGTLCITGFLGWGAWSVVLASLATSLGSLALVLLASARRPRLRLARDEVRPLLRFGAMISAETAFYAITARAFSLLFGHFHGLAALGNFQIAWRLGEEVAALAMSSINRYGLSFFAGRERSAIDLRASFLTGTEFVTAATAPVFAGIALVANDLVPVVFGARWEASIAFLQIIAISLLVAFQRILIGPALRAKGQQKILIFLAAFDAAFALFACIATAPFPAIFGAAGFALRLIFAAPFVALAIRRYLQISLKSQLKILAGPTAAAALMAIAVMGFQFAAASNAPLIRLAGSIAVGAITYPIVLSLLSPGVVTRAKSLFLRYGLVRQEVD